MKAITVKEHRAFIDESKCITCGTCVRICPAHAKKVRNDLDRLELLLLNSSSVIASLAPSIVSEFPSFSLPQIITFLRRLGFNGVSETSLGAQEVSAHVAQQLKEQNRPLLLSSACPVIVDYIRKKYPQYTHYLSSLLSPLLAHCVMLKQLYGSQNKIVFFGPCIAKKNEADEHDNLLEMALTFDDLRTLMQRRADLLIDLIPGNEDQLIPKKSEEGALYPIDGGMIKGIKALGDFPKVHFSSISGMEAVTAALEGLDEFKQKVSTQKVFLELLACPGGCINGPMTESRKNTINKQLAISEYCEKPIKSKLGNICYNISQDYSQTSETQLNATPIQLTEALRSIGKYKPEDELNCGGCGYDSCRSFATSLINKRAEPAMCVSYMRKLASAKANALITAMPAGVVILDENLQVIECNHRFLELLCPEVLPAFDGIASIKGMSLRKAISFISIFEKTLKDDTKFINREIHHGNQVLNSSIFPIEPHKIVGAIFQDITQPAVHREKIIEKAQAVIKQNMKTAQEIAYLLGENAAESEIILNSIIDSYSSKTDKKPHISD